MVPRLIATTLLVAAPAFVAAQGQDALYIRSQAATCANCHGTAGRSVEGSAVPQLAGMPRQQMEAQMLAFKSGSRPATVMHQLSKGYTDAQIAQLAGYFAAQTK